MFERHKIDLEQLSTESRHRVLAPKAGIDFSSNDYLGLGASTLLSNAARDALDRGVPVGSGGSRLLRGNEAEHEMLESEAAAFFGTESALYFSTGYTANSALLSTLPQRGDLIVHDELVHASAHEGLRLSRAESVSVRHNDAGAFADAISRWRAGGGKGTAWIAVESLYSMDGDIAPLDDLMAIADQYDGAMLVDEAHATGVFGENGRGLTGHLGARENLVTLHTFGKALGCEGAVICGPAVVRDFLINRARGFIFSTAPSPLLAATARAALAIMRDNPERRDHLWQLIARAESVLKPHYASPAGSQIIPVILGDDARTMQVANHLQQSGFDVRGIRPPTVPAGTSRLRISITCNVTLSDIDALADALGEALK
jgi:8-amino-7-oxononanoate synthase